MITKTQNPKLHAIEVECEVTRGQRSREVRGHKRSALRFSWSVSRAKGERLQCLFDGGLSESVVSIPCRLVSVPCTLVSTPC